MIFIMAIHHFSSSKYFENNKVDVVYGDDYYYHHRCNIFLKNNSKNLIRSYISGDYSKKRLAWGFMPAHPSMFVRRNIYDEVGYFKTSYKIAADYEFLCRLISRKN